MAIAVPFTFTVVFREFPEDAMSIQQAGTKNRCKNISQVRRKATNWKTASKFNVPLGAADLMEYVMAKMIPEQPFFDEIRRSSAEDKIFRLFRDAPDTDDWIVLHSYRVVSNEIETEIDFVVLAPELGIFGIEVKGGVVRRECGEWFSTDRYGYKHSIKDPFKQASAGIHALMNSRMCNFVIGYGVMFPDVKFDLRGKEIAPWQIFDKQNNDDVSTFIKGLSEKANRKKPNKKEVQLFAEILRGDIEPKLNDLIEIAERGLILLTEKQKEVLDRLKYNERIVIEGPAGTGKTILAIEAAKRAAKQGLKTAIFCYNTLVMKWIKEEVKSEVNITVNTIHDFMVNHIKLNGVSFEYEGRNFIEDWEIIKEAGILWNQEIEPWPKELYSKGVFWEKDIPQKMLEVLKCNPVEFDKIILDEAQDLVKGDYLAIIDKLLKGGLSKGTWIAFADFYQDVIRREYDPETARNILSSNGSPAFYSLDENCRNTIEIGKQIERLMKFDLKYKFAEIACPEVRFESWPENRKELQAGKLNEILKELVERDGIARKDIVVLLAQTNLTSDSGSLSSEKAKSELKDFTLKPYGTETSDEIAFTSIGKFKGMESPVVILLDIDSYRKNDAVINLMYVGLSRARDFLIVLESEEARMERMEINPINVKKC